MIATESRLWQKLAEAAILVRGDPAEVGRLNVRSLSRIETPSTQNGVSDVEYAINRYSGWIELKTSSIKRDESKLTFHAPFTTAQYTWIRTHHLPSYYQRSWLLVGRMGVRTWSEWLLIPPRPALLLTQMRVAPSLLHIREQRGVHSFLTAREVLSFLGDA